MRKPTFKVDETVRHLKRRSKFKKEATLTGNWSNKMYKVHSIHIAHLTQCILNVLAELGTNKPSSELPPIREDFLRRSYVNELDTFIVERILDKKRS